MPTVKPVTLLAPASSAWYGSPVTNTHSTHLDDANDEGWTISDASQTGLRLTDDSTVTFWYRFQSLPDDQNTVSSKNDLASKYSYIWAMRESSGSYLLRSYMSEINDASSRHITDYTLSYTPVVGTWYFIAMTYDMSLGTTTSRPVFYEGDANKGNGTAIVDDGISALAQNDAEYAVGWIPNGAAFSFDGDLDQVTVWDRVLTDVEIGDLFALSGGIAGPVDNLKSSMNFNNNANDQSGLGNNMTGRNSPTFTTSVH